ncbi:MAG: 1-(5-phosphoribosyl)-5-((5-phosphoribosylamino)methylideneamino)imidazole-4-carboxamide isomerase, partial [Chloroflexi bacterium]|nr:1-(5-phosphoribosyl)-5-((5-phosphoribosylamino)methylideneamino)imidazole-4-carboxamide isomerase [Chloroflexota bacterium]
MEVIPAIDIRGGRCARLFKGDYSQETVFDNDPVDAALRWVDMGAQRLHVIDLDGAKDGVRTNAATVKRVVNSVDVPIQMGGGIRSVEDADAVFQMGVQLAIFGTAAVENPEAIEIAVGRFGTDSVCVSVDAKNGMVRTRGWLSETGMRAIDLLKEMAAECHVRHFIY